MCTRTKYLIDSFNLINNIILWVCVNVSLSSKYIGNNITVVDTCLQTTDILALVHCEYYYNNNIVLYIIFIIFITNIIYYIIMCNVYTITVPYNIMLLYPDTTKVGTSIIFIAIIYARRGRPPRVIMLYRECYDL